MIIYCNSIWLEDSTSLENIFSCITYWLHSKTNDPIFPDNFLNQPFRNFKDGSFLEVLRTNEDFDFPRLFSFRYIQQDNEVIGRRWITEIGIRQNMPSNEIQVSFLVQTSEISVSVPQPKLTTRPWLVTEILKRCKPSQKTVGTIIKTLDRMDEVEALAYEFNNEDRQYPIVLISPTSSGDYLVDLGYLLGQLGGLAEIIQISTDLDTFEMSGILGKSQSAYNGAINIIYPPFKKNGVISYPTYLLLSNTIEEFKVNGKQIESEILKIITHRMNLPNSRLHITPEFVKDTKRNRELANLRKKYIESGDLKAYIELQDEQLQQLQSDNQRFQKQIDILQTENEYYVDEFEKADEDRKKAQFKSDNLESQLEALKTARQQRGESSECSEELRILIDTYLSEGLSPAQSLELTARLYPDRVVILENAYKTAKESSKFRDRKVVFDLLRKLLTNYWQALVDGKGDTEARSIFGNSFAAKESETAEKNKEIRNQRTFSYNGVDIEMMKHLKFGIKDSKTETLRIHFEWLAEERKIIIGYCGVHLDLN